MLLCYPAGKTGKYTIPNTVTSIEYSAFDGCSKLTSISIPNSVTIIRASAFDRCSKLTSISVDVNNTVYCSTDGVLFNKDQTILLCYPSGKTGNYTIPNSVTIIEDCAFSGCRGLTSISIPNSVTTIERVAFRNCRGLKEIHIKAINPPSIKENSFEGVSKSIPVYVCGSVSKYRKDDYWGKFTNIIEDTNL
jgi:hypothetical protein